MVWFVSIPTIRADFPISFGLSKSFPLTWKPIQRLQSILHTYHHSVKLYWHIRAELVGIFNYWQKWIVSYAWQMSNCANGEFLWETEFGKYYKDLSIWAFVGKSIYFLFLFHLMTNSFLRSGFFFHLKRN